MTTYPSKAICNIAAEMLECESVHHLDSQFQEYLLDIERYCNLCGGHVCSRQVIAKAIVDWQLIPGKQVVV